MASGFTKFYRTHTKKTVMWPLPALKKGGAQQLSDFRPLFDPNAQHPYTLDNVKQIALYTDCLRNAHWSVPEEGIDRDLAAGVLGTAELLTPDRDVQTGEIEVWIKHLRPVCQQPFDVLQKAMVSAHEACVRLGYIKGKADGMAEFVGRTEKPDPT